MACGGCNKTRLKNTQVKVPYNTKGTYMPKIKGGKQNGKK
jgi:hypothetical protein